MGLFLLSVIVFTVCTINLNAHVNAKSNDDNYFCESDMLVPISVANHCPDLNKDETIKSYVANLVNNSIQTVHDKCIENAVNICKVIQQKKKHSTEAHENCKNEVRDHICALTYNHQSGLGQKIYRLYMASVTKILTHTMKSDAGKEKYLCQLFKPNKQLYGLIKAQKCGTIGNISTRSICNRVMKKIEFH